MPPIAAFAALPLGLLASTVAWYAISTASSILLNSALQLHDSSTDGNILSGSAAPLSALAASLLFTFVSSFVSLLIVYAISHATAADAAPKAHSTVTMDISPRQSPVIAYRAFHNGDGSNSSSDAELSPLVKTVRLQVRCQPHTAAAPHYTKSSDTTDTVALTLSHFTGTCASAYALTLSSIICVHTWRALEPALAGLFTYCAYVAQQRQLLGSQQGIARSFGLMFVVAGVWLGTSSEANCTGWQSIAVASIINTTMILRNSTIKRYAANQLQHVYQQMYIGSTVMSVFGLLAILYVQPTLLLGQLRRQQYMLLLVAAAVTQSAYTQISLFVCSQLTLLSHSLLALMKRPILLISACVWYAAMPSTATVMGNAVSLSGLLIYTICNQQISSNAAPPLPLVSRSSNEVKHRRAPWLLLLTASLMLAVSIRQRESQRADPHAVLLQQPPHVFTVELPAPGATAARWMLENMVTTYVQHNDDPITIYTSDPTVYLPLQRKYPAMVLTKRINISVLRDTPLQPLEGRLVELKWRIALEAQTVDCPIYTRCTRISRDTSMPQLDLYEHLSSLLALALTYKHGGTYLDTFSHVRGSVPALTQLHSDDYTILWINQLQSRSDVGSGKLSFLSTATANHTTLARIMHGLMNSYNHYLQPTSTYGWTIAAVVQQTLQQCHETQDCHMFQQLASNSASSLELSQLHALARTPSVGDQQSLEGMEGLSLLFLPPEVSVALPAQLLSRNTTTLLHQVFGNTIHQFNRVAAPGRVAMAQMSYAATLNNGDVVQAVAAMQYYPMIDYFVNRDRLWTTSKLLYDPEFEDVGRELVDMAVNASEAARNQTRRAEVRQMLALHTDISPPVTHMISNAWMMRPNDHWVYEWPPPAHIQPLLISMHYAHGAFGESDDFVSTLRKPGQQEYYNSRGGVLARDTDTVKLLEEHGVAAKFVGCLTLTLNKYLLGFDKLPRTDDYHIIGLKISYENATRLLPEWLLTVANYSGSDHTNVWATDLPIAHRRLATIATAKLVITSLLHVALPALAFGTPVMLVLPAEMRDTDPRFSGLQQLFHHVYSDDELEWSYNYTHPLLDYNRSYHQQIVTDFHNILAQHPVYGPMSRFYNAFDHPVLQ